MEIASDHHNSESDGLSSDMGGFLSGSCMENDDKGDPADPFSTENTLNFAGDSSRFDSDCILSSSLADGVSVPQSSSCDATGSAYSITGDTESLPSNLTGETLLLSGTQSSSEQKQNNPMAPQTFLLANTADSKDYVTAGDQKLEFLSPFQFLTPVSQSHPVVIGNATSAAFVKNVLQGVTLQSSSSSSASPSPPQASTFVSTKEQLNLPPGLVLLSSTLFPQFSLLPSASGISSPLVIQLPPAAGLDTEQLSALGLNLLTSLPVSTAHSGSVSGFGNADSYVPSVVPINTSSVLAPASAPFVSLVSLASEASLTATQSCVDDSACTSSSSSGHVGVDLNSVSTNTSTSSIVIPGVTTPLSSSSSSPSSSLSTSQHSSKTNEHPLVISCTPPNAAVSKGLQQILDHYMQQNKTTTDRSNTQSESKLWNIKADPKDFTLPAGTEPGPSSAYSKPRLESVKEVDGDIEVSTFKVPGLGEKSNSVVVVLRRNLSRTSAQSQTNSASASTSSASGTIISSTIAQPALTSVSGEKFDASNADTDVEEEEDEIDGAAVSAASSVLSENKPIPAIVAFVDNQTASAEANSVNEETRNDSHEERQNDDETVSQNSATDSSTQWVQVKVPDPNARKSKKSHQYNDDIQKFIPLTVKEKLTSDVCRPIIICIIQEDGVKRQVNINPVEMDVTDSTPVSGQEAAGQNNASGELAEPTPSSHRDIAGETQAATSSSNDIPQDNNLNSGDQGQFEGEEETEDKHGVAVTFMKTSATAKGKKSIQCDLCTAVFTRRGNFLRHRKVHTVNLKEDKHFKCPYCDRPFLQRCDMKRHMAIHTDEHPFHCQTCGKGYIRKSDLVVHERFHSKERAFKCEICERCFYQSGDLRRHKRIVHSEQSQLWSCAHCNRKYTREVTLIRHMKTVHSDILLQYVHSPEPMETDGDIASASTG
ncbi:hypothetical protein V1264_014807 [Littorina saxatilis]